MENLKEQIKEIMNKIDNDPTFEEKFKEDPVTAIENLTGVDLPNDKINSVIDAIKAKMNLDESGLLNKLDEIDAGNILGKLGNSDDNGMLGKLTGLFK